QPDMILCEKADKTGKDKIKSLEELPKILAALRSDGKKIVHCHGAFDLLHIGHIRHFQEARTFGDILVVTITPDRHINKGPDRPAFGEQLRAEAVAALACVDYVAVNRWPMAMEIIKLLKPHFYVKGSEYREAEKDITGGITLERLAVESAGGRLVFTDDLTFSSSNLINRHLAVLPKEVSDYLADFSRRYGHDDIMRYLDAARTLRVLMIGETIIDEYQYCESIGKSGKEPILAAKYAYSEKFAGGVLAAANHVASFSDRVSLLTFLGTVDSHEEFIRERLHPGVEPLFLYMENAPTILKRRFVELYPFQKIFELYIMNGDEGNSKESQDLCGRLREILPQYDAVIVTDYGHGMISPEAVDVLCRESRFLAVNTQVNAGNQGFNTVSRYPKADYICVSEKELRLDARSRKRDLRDIVGEAARKHDCEQIVVTRGRSGSLAYSKEDGFFETPALTNRIVDRVGAGDAVFSLTSLLAAQKAPMELLSFVGSVAGAQAVVTVGHRKSLERVALGKHIASLLK
ncbi:MAG: adenylyltransferase/cytidyltransferase family protein, partial [Armatimonadetes bacterium]|nr:adenylyltransferase/cytidyltransferase family protein [Armatimonadota bacterium]